MLTDAMKKFLGADDKQGYNTSQYYKRVVEDSHEAIKDLVLLTQKLPEDRQDKIFTDDTLKPLVEAILKAVDDKDRAKRENRQLGIAIMLARQGLDRILSITEYNPIVNNQISIIKDWLNVL